MPRAPVRTKEPASRAQRRSSMAASTRPAVRRVAIFSRPRRSSSWSMASTRKCSWPSARSPRTLSTRRGRFSTSRPRSSAVRAALRLLTSPSTWSRSSFPAWSSTVSFGTKSGSRRRVTSSRWRSALPTMEISAGGRRPELAQARDRSIITEPGVEAVHRRARPWRLSRSARWVSRCCGSKSASGVPASRSTTTASSARCSAIARVRSRR